MLAEAVELRWSVLLTGRNKCLNHANADDMTMLQGTSALNGGPTCDDVAGPQPPSTNPERDLLKPRRVLHAPPASNDEFVQSGIIRCIHRSHYISF